jgi:hypothetical protein
MILRGHLWRSCRQDPSLSQRQPATPGCRNLVTHDSALIMNWVRASCHLPAWDLFESQNPLVQVNSHDLRIFNLKRADHKTFFLLQKQ